MRRQTSRLLIWILLTALWMQLLPGAVFAAGEEAVVPAEEETTESEAEQEEHISETEQEVPAQNLYFGQLHAHSAHSDIALSPEEVFSSAREAGLDFLVLTDHGDSLTQESWQSGGAIAAAHADEAFLALRGYEMSWPEGLYLGHIGVFGTASFTGWQEEPYRTYASGLENFYAWLAEQPSALGQFHHPGTFYGNFKQFAYHEDADRVICLLEVVSEEGRCYDAYTDMLDAGWHVAPANNGDPHNPGSSGRTVAALTNLTEENLYAALRNHRVYATEDNDLAITYSLSGYPMGSLLERRQVGDTAVLEVQLQDPTDEQPGLVEVITQGGAVLASRTAETNSAGLTFALSSEYAYYYLRITQPDGDIAVTAPVWIDPEENAGISAFVCGTAVPVQGKPVELTVSLYNEESAPLQVQSIRFLMNGQEICSLQEPFPVDPGMVTDMSAVYTHPGLGEGEITAVVTATLEGHTRTYEQSLRLSWRRGDMVTGLLADGTHGNAGLALLDSLTALAARDNITVTVETQSITEQTLENSGILLVITPEEAFSEEFLSLAAEYVGYGGSLVVCADPDSDPRELNRLLEAVGSSLGLTENHVSGEMTLNMDAELCTGIHENQRWYPEPALAVTGGTQIAGNSEAVLAFEEVSGAKIYVCGSLFFREEALAEPKNIWQEPYANRTLWQNLLGITRRELPLSSISDARVAQPGQVLRLRGYVTAGTSNPHTTFSDTLYFQDDTGGIAVMPFTEPGIPLGTALQITGSTAESAGEILFSPISWEILEFPLYNYQPVKLTCAEALDYDAYGGSLVRVEGICRGVTYREDGTVSALVIEDSSGEAITAVIEEGILSGTEGRNVLHRMVKSGREFRVTGLLCAGENGAMIRIRNCDEVVYISPIPYTGDGVGMWVAALFLSAALLILLKAKKHCSY